MWSPARGAAVVIALLTGLLVTIVGTSWLQETRYHPSSTDTMYCPAVDPVTTAKVTVNARITSAGFTYPRLQSTVDMVFPMEAPGSSALLSGADTPLYRRIMGCLLGRPYWQRDTDRRPALPTISTDGKHLKIHYESSGDLVPAPKMLATRIGYFSFYHDDGGTWMLDLAYPHALLGSEWTVQITAPPGWLNSPTPPPSGVPDSSRMDWGPLRPAGPAAEAGSANCFDPADCVQVHLAVGTPHKLLAAGSWFPGGLVASLLSWAPWLLLLGWTFRLVGPFVVDSARPGAPISLRRLLLPVWLISGAALLITASSYLPATSTELTYSESLWLMLGEGMAFTVLAVVGGLCWGLSPLPTVGIGLLALGLAAAASSGINAPDDATARFAGLLLSGYVLLFLVLAVAGFLNALRLLIDGRVLRHPLPEHLCWIAATVIALVLLAERNGVQLISAESEYWLSESLPSYSDLLFFLIGFPAELSAYASQGFGALVVGALLRAMFDTATWDEGRGSPLARDRLLALGGAVLFASVDWDVYLWNWPMLLWVVVLPVIVVVFRRFRSILDAPVDSGWSLRLVVLAHGLPQLRADAKRWRAAVREGRSIDKRLGQGTIEIADHRTELGRVQQEADSSRGLILANGVDQRLVNVTPVDLLLVVGPHPTRAANARFAATIAALWGLPFLVLLTGWRWMSRSYQDSGSYLLSVVADAMWMTIVLVGTSAVIGMLWQHLPGRRGPLRVLPFVALYMITPVVGFVVPYLTDTERIALGLVEVLCFLAVVTFVGLAMDLRAIREIRPPWQLRVQTLAFAYGTENLPAQIAFLSAQVSAVIGLITFVKTGAVSDVGSPSAGGHSTSNR